MEPNKHGLDMVAFWWQVEIQGLHSYPLKYVLVGQPHCPLPAGEPDDGTQAKWQDRHCDISEPPPVDKKVSAGHNKHAVAFAILEYDPGKQGMH